MRPIKFRAWYERSDFERDENFMMNVYKIEYIGSEIEINEGYLIDEFKNVTNSTYAPAKLFLMQSTGLLDKNGVEIYEGDIVTYIDKYGQRKIGKVNYANAKYYIGNFETLSYASERYELEVIGDIYQNSELLEESN